MIPFNFHPLRYTNFMGELIESKLPPFSLTCHSGVCKAGSIELPICGKEIRGGIRGDVTFNDWILPEIFKEFKSTFFDYQRVAFGLLLVVKF